jgi:hypothetical protein
MQNFQNINSRDSPFGARLPQREKGFAVRSPAPTKGEGIRRSEPGSHKGRKDSPFGARLPQREKGNEAQHRGWRNARTQQQTSLFQHF